MDLLILIAYIVYAGVFGGANSGEPLMKHRHAFELDRNDERVIAWKKSVQKYEKRRIGVDAAEQLALKSIFRDIESAYTNYQIKAMSQAIANVSNRIDFVQDQLFSELDGGIERFLVERFLQGSLHRQFDKPAELELFLTAHTKMALFLGDCLCRRNEYEWAKMSWIEYRTFEVLKKFADKYFEDGRNELANIARKSLGIWIEHIESDNGFIRKLAHYHLDKSWPLIELGKITPERARIGACSDAITLIRFGYTPKWLDEFFDADELALKAIYLDIERAYTNNQAEAMVQAMARAAKHVGRVRDRPFFTLDWGFMGVLERHFLNDGRLRPFGSQPELERFMSIHAEMALFLSRCIDCDAEGNINYPIRELKRHVLDMFRKYVNQFHREGKKDFEAIAQKYLDKLNSQWVLEYTSDETHREV